MVRLYMDENVHGEVTIGQCVRDLEVIAFAGTPEDFSDRVHYLPL